MPFDLVLCHLSWVFPEKELQDSEWSNFSEWLYMVITGMHSGIRCSQLNPTASADSWGWPKVKGSDGGEVTLGRQEGRATAMWTTMVTQGHQGAEEGRMLSGLTLSSQCFWVLQSHQLKDMGYNISIGEHLEPRTIFCCFLLFVLLKRSWPEKK